MDKMLANFWQLTSNYSHMCHVPHSASPCQARCATILYGPQEHITAGARHAACLRTFSCSGSYESSPRVQRRQPTALCKVKATSS